MTSTIAPPNATPATELRMPSLGADMDHGTLVRWSIAPGAAVKRGDVVGEVETEKGVFELEATSAGVVAELLVAPGTRVDVGAPLARLGGPATATVAAPPPAAAIAPPPAAAPPLGAPAVPEVGAPHPEATPIVGVGTQLPPAAPPPTPPPAPRVPRASPAARRLAGERGVDLASIAGTGPHGVVRLADVEAALAAPVSAPPPAAPPDARQAMRRAIAAAVSRSKREIPHYYLSLDVDLSRAIAWLAAQNASRPVAERILPAALLLRGVAVALRAYPDLNGFWVDDALRPSAPIHLGVAISLRGGGLIAPAIHDADRLTLVETMRALADLVARTRSGGLRTSEMTDATVTVSNIGDEGAASLFGVINPPQVALVGFGAITERPWAEHGMLGARPAVTMTLAGDHRATDGHYGSRFLREVARLLQSPEAL